MMLRAVTPADRLVDGDAALLLFEGLVVKLGPLGMAIVELATDHVDVFHLSAELERRFGTPATGSSEQATRQAVADLIEIGVLESINEPTTLTRDPE